MPASISAGRRFGAYMLDYVLLMAYVGILFAVSGFVPESWFSSPGRSQLVGIVMLTGPVILAFSIAEGGPWQASLGKRLLGMRVVGKDEPPIGIGRALRRNLVKFGPWELGHTFTWRADVWPQEVTVAGGAFAMALVLAFAAPVVFGARRRAVWDRVAGTRVVSRVAGGSDALTVEGASS